MRHLLLLVIALQVACDRGVSVTYRVSMTPAEADSISQLSVVISDAVAQQHAMAAQGATGDCSLASYYRQVGGGGDWLDFCVAREASAARSEEHTSELQSQSNLVCRLLLEKKKKHTSQMAASL